MDGGTHARSAAWFGGVVLAVLSLAVPAVRAQVALLLPDLVSDWGEHDELGNGPSRVRIQEITWPAVTGDELYVVQFDGFVSNIGEGPVRIQGNPQTDEVYQWLLEAGGDASDPNDYEQGDKVTLVFETDDGHNHWHLENAMEYSLWNQARTRQVSRGAKVGFCLYDIEDIRPPDESDDPYYDGTRVDFCDQHDADSTDVEMGTSAGWRDVYHWGISQQWIDISDVRPGVYSLAAATDTGGQIQESDETNNGISFHPDPVTVPGHAPRSASATTTAGTPVVVDLPVRTFAVEGIDFGVPGDPVFRLGRAPEHGEVTVDRRTGRAVYTPDPGYTGTDSFVFAVENPASPYPRRPPTARVTIEVEAPEPAPVPGEVFEDVPPGHVFEAEIAWMAAQGITKGCTPTRFCPEDPVTRGQLASFLVRALGLPPASGDSFSDDDSSVHREDIEALAASDITRGCASDRFCPTDPVIRAQLASFLVRALEGVDALPEADTFDDDDGSVHEADIEGLAATGITRGCDTAKFCPTDPVTRGQLAAFLHRALR